MVNDARLSEARRALSRGDVLIAYDLARTVLGDDPRGNPPRWDPYAPQRMSAAEAYFG